MKKLGSFISRAYVALILAFLYLPIAVLIVFSFNSSNSRAVWSGFSFEWYSALIHDSVIMNALSTTLTVSLISAILATVVGTITAVGFHYMRSKFKPVLLTLNNIPLINADIVTGVSLCLLFVALGSVFKFDFGFGTLLIAHLTFNIPYVILSVMPKLRQLDQNLVDAAQDLGCTWFQAFFKVIIPEIKPGIVNGALIAFTMSIDDFIISYFNAGPKLQTLAMAIYAMTKKRVTPKLNALSTLLFITVLLLLLVVNIRSARQEKKRLAAARHK